MRASIPLLALAFLLLVAYSPLNVGEPSSLPAQTDTTWTWPENPENLQVLPADIGAFGLSQVMRSFTRALGVRCQHCHVGTEEMSLAEFDFVSDANDHKSVAREMMRMTWAINNDLLANLEGLHDHEGMRVTCYTCHRGSTTPETVAPDRPFQPPPADADADEHDDHEHEDGEDHDHGDDG